MVDGLVVARTVGLAGMDNPSIAKAGIKDKDGKDLYTITKYYPNVFLRDNVKLQAQMLSFALRRIEEHLTSK